VDDIVEVGVAHVSVDLSKKKGLSRMMLKKISRYLTNLQDGYLGGVLDSAVGDSERVDSPVQVECML
jgi:hypothetical protein